MKIGKKLAVRDYTKFFIYFLIFIGVSAWTLYTPLMGDDLQFVTKSIREIVYSGYNEYFSWIGRFWGQSIARFLILTNGVVSALLNGGCFTLLILLINSLSKNSENATRPIKCVILSVLTIGFIPTFGETVLWISGSGNYLWMTTICLLFLYYLKKVKFENGKFLLNIFLFILGCFLALLSGWSNENTGLGIIILSAFIIFVHPGKRLSYLKTLIWFVSIIGYIFLIEAPGNKVRLGAEANVPMVKRAILNFVESNKEFWTYDVTVILTILFFCVFSIVLTNWNIKSVTSNLEIIVYFLTGILVIYMLAAAPDGSSIHRAYFGGVIFMIISIGKCIPDNMSTVMVNNLVVSVIMIALFFGICRFSSGLVDSICTDHAYRQRYALIENLIKREGRNKVISIPKLSYSPRTEYSLHWEIKDNYNDYPNTVYKPYFKIKGITLKK